LLDREGIISLDDKALRNLAKEDNTIRGVFDVSAQPKQFFNTRTGLPEYIAGTPLSLQFRNAVVALGTAIGNIVLLVVCGGNRKRDRSAYTESGPVSL
jgi:hypothetical protein